MIISLYGVGFVDYDLSLGTWCYILVLQRLFACRTTFPELFWNVEWTTILIWFHHYYFRLVCRIGYEVITGVS